MKFSYYQVLSQLILGFLWLITAVQLELVDFEMKNETTLIAIPLAFVLGYFINSLSSWLESFLFWLSGGKPSRNLLRGKGMRKINFPRHAMAISFLKKEYQKEIDIDNDQQIDDLFNIALSYGSKVENVRIQEFNANYAFSRGMLITLLVITIAIFIHQIGDWPWDNWSIYVLILLMIASAYRFKERGYYFAREVLNNYLKLKLNVGRKKSPYAHFKRTKTLS